MYWLCTLAKTVKVFTVSTRCDVIHMPEVIASLFAWKRGFALPSNRTRTG